MKRPWRKMPQAKNINPYFWKKCFYCLREFRRERGYKVWRKNSMSKDFKVFICNECADCLEKARNMVLENLRTEKCFWCGKPIEKL